MDRLFAMKLGLGLCHCFLQPNTAINPISEVTSGDQRAAACKTSADQKFAMIGSPALGCVFLLACLCMCEKLVGYELYSKALITHI